MELGLSNRTALVFGGGGGLGGAIARALAAEGCKLAIADIDADGAKATAEDIARGGGTAIAVQWDVGDIASIDGRVGTIEKEIGEIEILVNNTGGPPPTPVAGQAAESWERQFREMVLGVIKITDRLVPAMRRRGWGRVITSTSSGVIVPIPNLGMSNALRSSLVGWSKTLAAEVGEDNVTANILVPGRIATKRIAYLDEQRAIREKRSVEDVSRESTRSIPLRRYGQPQEYANAAVFLASDAASYITGSVVRVDGGMIASV
jgi:3-oxoacyl-[acyl-carrier protein] reductase